MKLFKSKITTILSLFIAAILLASPSADAQFLKKLSKGLEKVNKTLEQANKELDNITKGASSENKKKSTSTTSSNESSMSQTAETVNPAQNSASVIDDSRWENAEPVYNTPFITENTKFMQLDQGDDFSSVNDGIFAIQSRGIISFWKISGEKLFDAEWEYCGLNDVVGVKFPIFNGGVAPALHRVPNSKGQKVICLLYANGAIKELDPSWKVVSNFADGLAIVKAKINYRDTYFYINKKGEKVYPHLTLYGGNKGAMRPLSDGLRAYPASYDSWGYIDANGKIVIQPIKKCSNATDFSEGYAWVRVCDDPTKPSSVYGEYSLIDKSGKVVFKSGVMDNTKISPVKNGMFYVYKNDKYNYYDTNFNLLASYEYATPFYNGYAYVSKNGNYGDGVDVINTKFEKLKNFTSTDFDGVSSLTHQPHFDPLGLGLVENADVENYFINARGNIILSYYENDDLEIEHFQPFTESGYAQFGVGGWGNDRYCGFLRPDGEIVWVLSYRDREETGKLPWPLPLPPPESPGPPPGFGPWPPDTLVIVKASPPIGPIVIERTFYNVTVSTEGEGTAKISPTGRFEFGDNATLSVTPAENWAVASITHDAENIRNISAGNAFSVTSNVHIKVKFVKKDEDQAPQHTGCYQGEKRLMVDDDNYGNITYYAQINSSQADANPYGDNTYGFIVAMIDPTKKYVHPDLSCYMFSAPFRISGYQQDKDNGNKWMVLDGGSFSIGNLKLNPGGNGLAGLYFQLIMAMNGFSQPTLTPRHYRLEMIDHNEETGEFTAGKLQAFSPEYGWLDAGDERLKKTIKGVFMTAYDSGMPANYFQGVTFKTAQKRNDVYWYPPVEWYGNNQDELSKVIESMGQMYRTHKSDYDELFDK